MSRVTITGELDLRRCGNKADVRSRADEVEIKIGDSLWLILRRPQAETLRQALTATLKD